MPTLFTDVCTPVVALCLCIDRRTGLACAQRCVYLCVCAFWGFRGDRGVCKALAELSSLHFPSDELKTGRRGARTPHRRNATAHPPAPPARGRHTRIHSLSRRRASCIHGARKRRAKKARAQTTLHGEHARGHPMRGRGRQNQQIERAQHVHGGTRTQKARAKEGMSDLSSSRSTCRCCCCRASRRLSVP